MGDPPSSLKVGGGGQEGHRSVWGNRPPVGRHPSQPNGGPQDGGHSHATLLGQVPAGRLRLQLQLPLLPPPRTQNQADQGPPGLRPCPAGPPKCPSDIAFLLSHPHPRMEHPPHLRLLTPTHPSVSAIGPARPPSRAPTPGGHQTEARRGYASLLKLGRAPRNVGDNIANPLEPFLSSTVPRGPAQSWTRARPSVNVCGTVEWEVTGPSFGPLPAGA